MLAHDTPSTELRRCAPQRLLSGAAAHRKSRSPPKAPPDCLTRLQAAAPRHHAALSRCAGANRP